MSEVAAVGFARVGVRGGGSATGWARQGQGSTFWLRVLRGSRLAAKVFTAEGFAGVGDRGSRCRGGGFCRVRDGGFREGSRFAMVGLQG